MTIEQYVSLMDKAIEQYPYEAEEELESGAKKLRGKLRRASPVGKAKHPHKLKNSWRVEMAGTTKEKMEAQIYSVAPHFHLVERGHVMKNAHGQITGFKQGTFFMKKTVEEESPGIHRDMADHLFTKLGGKLG